MLNSHSESEAKPEDVERVVREGPRGAIALAGVATLIVVALWFAFYFFVFMPRGVAS